MDITGVKNRDLKRQHKEILYLNFLKKYTVYFLKLLIQKTLLLTVYVYFGWGRQL